MGSMVRQNRRYGLNVSRRKVIGVGAENKIPSRTPINAASITKSVQQLLVQFDQTVILRGIPQWPTGSGVMPSAAVLNGTNDVLTLTYPLPSTWTQVTIPFEEPAIRNSAGGYMNPQTWVEPE